MNVTEMDWGDSQRPSVTLGVATEARGNAESLLAQEYVDHVSNCV